MDWDRLRIFHQVAHHKSLTRAADALSLSQSSVSRYITMLEEDLGVSLFHRHARGLTLSEQGEVLYRTVGEMAKRLEQASEALHDNSEKPRGTLSITAPTTLGTLWLTPQMKEFTQLYPEIEITLLCTDRELDLSKREADVALRLYPTDNPNMVQKSLVKLRHSIYAANDYLRLHGIPKSLSELRDHLIITYGESSNRPFEHVNWLSEAVGSSKGHHPRLFKINSLSGMRMAVKSGIGIAALPDYMMYRTRHVSKILEEVEGPQTEIHFVYPVELKNSKRIGVFRQFIQRKLAEYNF